ALAGQSAGKQHGLECALVKCDYLAAEFASALDLTRVFALNLVIRRQGRIIGICPDSLGILRIFSQTACVSADQGNDTGQAEACQQRGFQMTHDWLPDGGAVMESGWL